MEISNKKLRTVIAVVGPTASGKTELAIKLAQNFNGEIISCDSMQIYKGMDIGTAKPSKEELTSVKHHLVGFLDTYKEFSVADYVNVAEKTLDDVSNGGKLPVIAGGTGLYVRSLLYGIDFDDNSRDDNLRRDLLAECEAGNSEQLYNRLLVLDRVAAENLHKNNFTRLTRALEYCLVTGKKISEQSPNKTARYNYLMLGINYRNRETLYERINKRVDIMIDQGLIAEAKEFYIQKDNKTSAQAIGYKELFPYFEGKITLEEAVENIKRETRRYAKRQLTWFRKERSIHWIYADDYESKEKMFTNANRIAEKFLEDEN